MPPHPTVFIRKSVFNKIGKYKTNYKISSDYDFLLRALKKNNIKKIYIPKFWLICVLVVQAITLLKIFLKNLLKILR